MEAIKFNSSMIRISTPLHLSVVDARLSFSPSLQRSSTGLHALSAQSEDATCKDYFQRKSYAFRNCTITTWSLFKPKESFAPLHHHNKYNNHNKSRYIVPRSEVVGTGTPDVYPSSEPLVGPVVRGRLFYAVTAVAALLFFNFMVLAHPFVLLFDRYRRKAQYAIAKIWALATVTPFFKIKVEGLENLPSSDTPAVYVSNHQSFLDIYTLLTLGRNFKFISKTAIFLIPIIGWAMFFMGAIPLRRMDSKSQLECLKRCIDLVKKGASVFFFPEGTRSKDGKLGAFKKGAFSIAAKCGVPVVPITLIGTGEIMPAGKESIVNPGSVRIIIHKSIQGEDTQALCNEARDIIASGLNHHLRLEAPTH